MSDNMEIYDTTAGARIRFRHGDKIDKLTVKAYLGKTRFKVTSFDPVYKCACDCGNEQVRTQQYLTSSNIKRKVCAACGRKESTKLAGVRKSTVDTSAASPDCPREGREVIVARIMDEVWCFKFKPTFGVDTSGKIPDSHSLVSTYRIKGKAAAADEYRNRYSTDLKTAENEIEKIIETGSWMGEELT